MTSPALPDAAALPEGAEALAGRLAGAGGEAVRAVLLYGSRLLNAAPDRHSAYDFVVIVDDYGAFYRGLKAAREIHRPAWILRASSHVLPPNVIAFTPEDGRGGLAKCVVVSRAHFDAALSARPRDHFLLGRMVQRVGLVWTASEEDAAWTRSLLGRARAGVLDWMAPFLEGSFDAEALGARLLEVCYRGEIRPEASDRARVIFDAQRDHFREALRPGLEAALREGELVRLDSGYRLAAPVPAGRRLRWRWHFLRSKLRATARWAKYVVTFDNWLPYVARKVERRTGKPVELTPLERRFPLIFLWPRVFRVLLTRPEREDASRPEVGP